MVKKAAANSRVKSRKTPQQQRSSATVAVIVEAAARVLEQKGLEGFNTNAVANTAGVSIGSLYQYFPDKHALLSALIEREMEPLLRAVKTVAELPDFATALHAYVQACVNHQMKRPDLARWVDIAERREIFNDQVADTKMSLLVVMQDLLRRPDAPPIPKRRVAASDLLAIIQALTDVAGERAESASPQLIQRIEGAALGYLGACAQNLHSFKRVL